MVYCRKREVKKKWHCICSAKLLDPVQWDFLPISKRTSQINIKEYFYSKAVINICAPTETEQEEFENFYNDQYNFMKMFNNMML